MNKNELQIFKKLPTGWETTTLGEVLPILYGKGLTKAKRDNDGPYAVYGSSGQVGNHSKALTKKPTLIIGRKGSVGEVYYSRFPCWPIDTTYYVEEKENQTLPFFKYLLTGLMLSKLDKSTAIPGLSRDDYNNVQVAIAPFNEQKRIVAEIEKQFSRLDEAVDNLKRVKANLKRYKASVLKAAVEGKLTEEWRKANPDVEPADKLLERILAERRKKLEKAELAKMKKAGKEPKDDKWKKKYKEPENPSHGVLSILPEKWSSTTLETLCSQIGDVDHKMPKAKEEGIPYISTKDFKSNNQIDFENAKKISQKDYKKLSRKIYPEYNDILLSRYGTVGEVRFVKTKIKFQASYSVAIVKPVCPELSKYLAMVLKCDPLQKQIKKYTRATAQPDLGMGHIRQLVVPIPPIAEQKIIIQKIDEELIIVSKIEKQLDTNLKRSERLRQAMLKKAFTGKLVTQN